MPLRASLHLPCTSTIISPRYSTPFPSAHLSFMSASLLFLYLTLLPLPILPMAPVHPPRVSFTFQSTSSAPTIFFKFTSTFQSLPSSPTSLPPHPFLPIQFHSSAPTHHSHFAPPTISSFPPSHLTHSQPLISNSLLPLTSLYPRVYPIY